jgi:hypothetical protein
MADSQSQAVAGLTAPQISEALIRDAWPGVASAPASAGLAKRCYESVVLAPIGWLILAPFLLKRVAGFLPGLGGLATRYRLTNRRLMVCRGSTATAAQEVPLERIKDVKLSTDDVSDYFFSGTLTVLGDSGQTLLTMPGVREAESFRHSILQSAAAWGPILAQPV